MAEKFNKKDLGQVVAEKFDLTKKESNLIVETVFDEIMAQVKAGNDVDISGFGKFTKKHKPAREGINPRTKEKVSIAEKDVPAFKPAKSFKESF